LEEDQKKVTIKIWDYQGVEEDRRRPGKAIFEEQDVEKMAVELKETTKKEVIVKGAKGTGKKNE
jgi:hypothetical protein